jgi:hypothetical protein
MGVGDGVGEAEANAFDVSMEQFMAASSVVACRDLFLEFQACMAKRRALAAFRIS